MTRRALLIRAHLIVSKGTHTWSLVNHAVITCFTSRASCWSSFIAGTAARIAFLTKWVWSIIVIPDLAVASFLVLIICSNVIWKALQALTIAWTIAVHAAIMAFGTNSFVQYFIVCQFTNTSITTFEPFIISSTRQTFILTASMTSVTAIVARTAINIWLLSLVVSVITFTNSSYEHSLLWSTNIAGKTIIFG